jgi:hypothetical protein
LKGEVHLSVVVLGLFFLACGWKFYKDFKFTRYLALKNSGHPQYFGGALCGALIFVICIFIDAAALQFEIYRMLSTSAANRLPMVTDLAAREATEELVRLAFLGVPVLWLFTRLLNVPLHRSPSLILAVAKKTRIIDELEELLYYCLSNDLMALITLKSKKVYVGIPKRHSPDPDRDRVWLAIWPVASGCREDSGALSLNTFYPDFERLFVDTNGKRSREDFQLVIPIGEISAAQSFDFESFNKFSNENEVLTNSSSLSEAVEVSSGDIKRATDSQDVKEETSNPENSEVPGGFPLGAGKSHEVRISNEIISAGDAYQLRCYGYYVSALLLSVGLVRFSVVGAISMLAVGFISSVEATKPIYDRLTNKDDRHGWKYGVAACVAVLTISGSVAACELLCKAP